MALYKNSAVAAKELKIIERDFVEIKKECHWDQNSYFFFKLDNCLIC